MDKTFNINLGGILFQIDEDAYQLLRDYLQSVNNRFAGVPGGNETIEDIESRIAEILQSQRGTAGVITRDNVETMIRTVGKPEDFDQDEVPPANNSSSQVKKTLYRDIDDKVIGGVCSGIAAYLNSDPVIFRILFIVFTACFGIGLFIYAGLWIAVPAARTIQEKRSLYSNAGSTADNRARQRSGSHLGNAINEIFRALARVIFIIVRIFLIIFGVAIVLTGFLSILCWVMVIIFHYPGSFTLDHPEFNLTYLPDFLGYIVNQSTVPWIMILSSIVFILPMLALIYWGVKMIFWFSARDGVISLVLLVVWVMSMAALAIVLFNEGISFAKTATTSVETVLQSVPDTVYVTTARKTRDLETEKLIALPHEEYSVYLNEPSKELNIRAYLSVDRSFDKNAKVEIRKKSTGRTEADAERKCNALTYNYSFRNDTLCLDEYFTLPSGAKWSADEIGVHLFVPRGTIVKFDERSKILVHSHFQNGSEEYLESRWNSDGSSWRMTEDGIEPAYYKDKKIK